MIKTHKKLKFWTFLLSSSSARYVIQPSSMQAVPNKLNRFHSRGASRSQYSRHNTIREDSSISSGCGSSGGINNSTSDPSAANVVDAMRPRDSHSSGGSNGSGTVPTTLPISVNIRPRDNSISSSTFSGDRASYSPLLSSPSLDSRSNPFAMKNLAMPLPIPRVGWATELEQPPKDRPISDREQKREKEEKSKGEDAGKERREVEDEETRIDFVDGLSTEELEKTSMLQIWLWDNKIDEHHIAYWHHLSTLLLQKIIGTNFCLPPSYITVIVNSWKYIPNRYSCLKYCKKKCCFDDNMTWWHVLSPSFLFFFVHLKNHSILWIELC